MSARAGRADVPKGNKPHSPSGRPGDGSQRQVISGRNCSRSSAKAVNENRMNFENGVAWGKRGQNRDTGTEGQRDTRGEGREAGLLAAIAVDMAGGGHGYCKPCGVRASPDGRPCSCVWADGPVRFSSRGCASADGIGSKRPGSQVDSGLFFSGEKQARGARDWGPGAR